MKLFMSPGLPSINMDPSFRRKDKVIVVIGATGTGKSKLAIDLATRFPAEIINSDEMQVYQGLDIVTNKVTEEECRGIPHHLLGIMDPNFNFTANDFKQRASLAIESILERGRLPIITGGSNSYIEALVDDHPEFRMKYECCFIWVDVALQVLKSFVSERVDRMVEAGLVDEVRRMFDSTAEAEYTHGIRKAIGMPEMDEYLRGEACGINDEETQERLLQTAISKIKENTCILADRQLQKISRLCRRRNWNMHRLDATEVFSNRVEADQAWEKHVARPAKRMVGDFLVDPESTSAAAAQNLDWAKIIVVYCLSTAVAMALTPVQAHSNQLPLTFRFLGLTILFSFACIMVSKFIHNNNCPRITVDLFHSFGVFFGITAFFICITIPFPLWFKSTASVIYVVSGLVIMFCNYFYN